MKKITLLPAILFLFFLTTVTAQETIHFEAKDGTSADVTLHSTNPDEGRNNSIYFGGFGPEGVNMLGFSVYNPGTFYINGLGGPTGGMLDASYFLTTTTKESSISNSLKGYGNVRYVGKIPLTKRTAFGVHGGAGYTDYSSFNTEYGQKFSTMSAFGGVSLLKAKHVHLTVDDERRGERNGTLIVRLNADGIFYFSQKFRRGKGADPEDDIDVNTMTRKFGVRIYVDGKATVWGRRGRMSLNYMLGIGRNADISSRARVFGGLGFGYNF